MQNEIRKIVHFQTESGGSHYFTAKIVFLMEQEGPWAGALAFHSRKELPFTLCKYPMTVGRSARSYWIIVFLSTYFEHYY